MQNNYVGLGEIAVRRLRDLPTFLARRYRSLPLSETGLKRVPVRHRMMKQLCWLLFSTEILRKSNGVQVFLASLRLKPHIPPTALNITMNPLQHEDCKEGNKGPGNEEARAKVPGAD